MLRKFGSLAVLVVAFALGTLTPAVSFATPPSTSPGLIFPFPEGQTWRITCGYADGGGCQHPDNQWNRYALDMQHVEGAAATQGQPISAAAEGTVSIAEWGGEKSFGWYVQLDHADGSQTVYAHFEEAPEVAAGQEVVQGQVLGHAGCTGRCTGPHLHFVLLRDGESVRPEPICGIKNLDDGQLHTACPAQQGFPFVAAAPGDANCDGSTDPIDAAVVLQLEAAFVSALACEHAADVNWDDDVNALDAALILQFAAGLFESLAPGSWSDGEPLPTARTEVASAQLDGVIYVIGGFDGTGANTDVVEAYDTETGEWSTKAPLPVALDHAAAAAFEGKVYVIGGYTSLAAGEISSAVYEYDPSEDEWTARAEMPLPRAAAAAVELHGVIYVFGGVGPSPDVPVAYVPAFDGWFEIAPMSAPREHLTASAVGDAIYVIGGRQNTVENVDTVEVYVPEDDAWTTLTAMPTSRGGLTSAVLDGRIHVLGGEDLAPGGDTFGEHEVYQPGSDAWRLAPELPTPRHGLAAQVVGGRLYVIGGGVAPGLSISNIVEVFDLGPSYAPPPSSRPPTAQQ